MMATYILLGLCFFVTSMIWASSNEQMSQKSNSPRNFNYSNCYDSGVPLYIHALDITPDPIRLGQFISITFNLTLDKDAGVNNSRLEVDLSWRLKTKTGYTELCEILGESLCHFNDFCSYIKDRKNCPSYVPKYLHNNCSCPIEEGLYYTPNAFAVFLPAPSFEVRGTFELTVNIHERDKILGCFEIHFCITDCKPLSY